MDNKHKFKKYRKSKNKVSSFHSIRHPLRLDVPVYISDDGNETTLRDTLSEGGVGPGRCENAFKYIKAAYWSKGKIIDLNDTYIVKGKFRKTLRVFLRKPELYLRPERLQMETRAHARKGEWEQISRFINFAKLSRAAGLSRTAVRKHIKKAIYIGCLIVSQDEQYQYHKEQPYSSDGKDSVGRTRYFKKGGKKVFIYEKKLSYGTDIKEIRKAKKRIKEFAEKNFFTS